MKKLLSFGLLLACGLASAQVNLTTLPAGTTPNGTELILAQQPPSACNGCTVTLTVGQLAAYGISQLNATDIINLWTGGCNSSTFLAGNGTCQSFPAIPSSSNPSATVGLTTVNGSASTFMRSDAAPPINQAIIPTWTGLHTFSAGISLSSITSSAGVALNGATGGSEGSGSINATNLYVNGNPVAIAATGCSSGSFTGTLTGFTSNPILSIDYTRCGNTVSLYSTSSSSGTSNSVIMSLTGIPAIILGSSEQVEGHCFAAEDNGNAGVQNSMQTVTTTSIEIYPVTTSGTYVVTGGNWTGSGTKGLTFPCVYTISPF